MGCLFIERVPECIRLNLCCLKVVQRQMSSTTMSIGQLYEAKRQVKLVMRWELT